MRLHQLNIRLSDEERARFERVAEELGVSVPEMVRFAVASKARELAARPDWLKAPPRT